MKLLKYVMLIIVSIATQGIVAMNALQVKQDQVEEKEKVKAKWGVDLHIGVMQEKMPSYIDGINKISGMDLKDGDSLEDFNGKAKNTIDSAKKSFTEFSQRFPRAQQEINKFNKAFVDSEEKLSEAYNAAKARIQTEESDTLWLKKEYGDDGAKIKRLFDAKRGNIEAKNVSGLIHDIDKKTMRWSKLLEEADAEIKKIDQGESTLTNDPAQYERFKKAIARYMINKFPQPKDIVSFLDLDDTGRWLQLQKIALSTKQ